MEEIMKRGNISSVYTLIETGAEKRWQATQCKLGEIVLTLRIKCGMVNDRRIIG